MSTLQIILVIILIISTFVGYFLIKHVPTLLHTPLMSGMNALSGITLIGAIVATSEAIKTNEFMTIFIGGVAIVIATINVTAGFLVTHRMLAMFKGKSHD